MSRSAYYKKPKQCKVTNSEVEDAVIRCFNKNKGRYGRIRIRKALKRQGITVGEWRIARILKENNLAAKSGRTGKRRVSKPTEEQYIEENLVKDKFSVKVPNMLWCSDISELE